MFTEQETSVIGELLRAKVFALCALAQHDEANVCMAILNKLEMLEDCTITMHCDGCGEELELDAFAGHHVCRGCGCRICDDCHDNGPTCGAPKCDDWEKYERADYEYDRSKDR
jgi:hypothetical protein